MYGGRTYTEAEFAAAKANGTLPQQPAIPGVATGSFPSFTEVMGFSGAPEIINGECPGLLFLLAPVTRNKLLWSPFTTILGLWPASSLPLPPVLTCGVFAPLLSPQAA